MAKGAVRWSGEPVPKDFEAALSFLSLVYPRARAAKLVRSLRRATKVTHAAKDLLRASGLPLLAPEEPHVAADLRRIRKGKSLSPVLLVQGDRSRAQPLLVADGYHRICAVCYYDEDAPISCLLVPG
jgi:hypothetical protein